MRCLAVVTTIDSREAANHLAQTLVARGLAACAQISEIDSFYTWEGAVQHASEFRVLFKTTRDQYPAIERAIVELHTYDLPAVHAYAIEHLYEPYAAWIEESCRGR
ncbi:MAG: divalent-cation tolerance protein CutA [Betaproteobacteria bacterium]|nr:divalent-cation tolerance protein CutA [Betaproteobacteria bacterium]